MKKYDIVKEEQVFKTGRMEGVKRTLQAEDGDTFTHTIIKSQPSVAVIIRDGKGNIAFIRQLRSTTNQYYWELPAGVMEPYECLMYNAAKREAEEETGLLIKDVEILIKGPSFLDPSKSDEDFGVAVATAYGQVERNLDEDEKIDKEVFWMSEEEVFARIRNQMENGVHFYEGMYMTGHSIYALLSYLFLCK